MSHRRKLKDAINFHKRTLLFSAQYEGNADILDDWAMGIHGIKGIAPEDIFIVVNNSSDQFFERVKALFPKGTVINVGVLKDTNLMAIEGEGDIGLTMNLYWLMSLTGNMAIEKAIKENYCYLLIMGGDDILDSDAMRWYRKFMEGTYDKDRSMYIHAPIGIVSPLIIAKQSAQEFNGITAHGTPIEFPTQDHHDWFFKDQNWMGLDYVTLYDPTTNNKYGKPLFWAMGSSGMLIKRDVFTKVKFDPKRYEFSNLYEKKVDLENENNVELVMKYKGEDYDYCYRVQDAGYKILMITKIFIKPLK